ncbi:hypothetical protein [Carboxylicivirga marina]|uniref:Uncharacterized protein n=1 Tax=Carboxylicivirga marina TaxID=2800988 RepID=A0ABS1HEU5_9BACT|nr:hypothetical protein [Carboxylicivirga marina]MBK3515734.1 hypothetical protein [Carboxylicivirga marina]
MEVVDGFTYVDERDENEGEHHLTGFKSAVSEFESYAFILNLTFKV